MTVMRVERCIKLAARSMENRVPLSDEPIGSAESPWTRNGAKKCPINAEFENERSLSHYLQTITIAFSRWRTHSIEAKH